jgi:hypothetical protein
MSLQASDVRDRILQDGNEPVGNTMEAFVTVSEETIERSRKAEKAARVRS